MGQIFQGSASRIQQTPLTKQCINLYKVVACQRLRPISDIFILSYLINLHWLLWKLHERMPVECGKMSPTNVIELLGSPPCCSTAELLSECVCNGNVYPWLSVAKLLIEKTHTQTQVSWRLWCQMAETELTAPLSYHCQRTLLARTRPPSLSRTASPLSFPSSSLCCCIWSIQAPDKGSRVQTVSCSPASVKTPSDRSKDVGRLE